MIANPPSLRFNLPLKSIADFCRRWSIARLEVSGSALRAEFGRGGDLDFVATYAPEALLRGLGK